MTDLLPHASEDLPRRSHMSHDDQRWLASPSATAPASPQHNIVTVAASPSLDGNRRPLALIGPSRPRKGGRPVVRWHLAAGLCCGLLVRLYCSHFDVLESGGINAFSARCAVTMVRVVFGGVWMRTRWCRDVCGTSCQIVL